MQIIHAADLHLGSKIDARLPKHLAEMRRLEVRSAFQNMLTYANQHNIHIILLAGDIFDSDLPLRQDKEFFYQLIEQNQHIRFYYLRGNHDCKTSYTKTLKNLKLFNDRWQYYMEREDGEEVVLAGIEQTAENAKTLYTTLTLEAKNTNIVLLHGQTSQTQTGKDIVNLPALQNKNIDYLALGHLHTYAYKMLDSRGQYAYCGCLEGRGFDELGAKGFIQLTVENKKITHRFIQNSLRQIQEIFVDLSDCAKFVDAMTKVEQTIQLQSQNLYRLQLIGKVHFECDTLAEIIQNTYQSRCFYLEVEDKTTIKYDIEGLQTEESLRGEFVRTVLQNESLLSLSKEKILQLGLQALTEKD